MIATFGLGIGTIPWLVMAEILPSRVRGLGSSFATAINWLVAAIVTTAFEPLSDIIGTDKLYAFIFAPVILLCAAFCAAFVPETTGKSFEQVQKLLHQKLRVGQPPLPGTVDV